MVSRSTPDPESLHPYYRQYCAVLQEELAQPAAFSVLLPGAQHRAPLGAAYMLLLEEQSLDMFACPCS